MKRKRKIRPSNANSSQNRLGAIKCIVRIVFNALAALSVTALVGCGSLPPRHFAEASPRFDPEQFFTGQTRSWGVFENRSGEPVRRFTTVAEGREQKGELVLHQKFSYEDGTTQERLWHIRRLDAHHLEATANDVVGKAKGEVYGNAFRWEYTVALHPGNPLFNVQLKQWMYLQAGGQVVVNRGTISKFGVELAQVTEYFHRAE